ncbi:MAG: RimK family protein [Pseudomonadota bacterium]
MDIFIIVDNPRDWPLDLPEVTVVSARAYLTEAAYSDAHAARVFNLCRSYRYQSLGYYVSLLAEARGHRPLPSAHTIEDLQSQALVRVLTEDLDALVQRSLAPIRSDAFELSIYFGRNVAARYDKLSQQLFGLLRAPLLRAFFERHDGAWQLRGVRPIAASDIPQAHQGFVVDAARRYFRGRRRRAQRRATPRYAMAILVDPDNPEPASNPLALKKFDKAGAALGLDVEFITRGDIGRLGEFDALFIRDTTFVNHYTYRFSRRAAAEGLVVIDDPESILKCNNKVYQAELLARHRLPAPRTLMVHRDNVADIVPTLGLPCVLKRPDSSFSMGVEKADSRPELLAKVKLLLEKSELIVAQEWLPTPFDWRVGVLDRRVLFVCRYYMAPEHWQIVRHGERRQDYVEGPTQACSVGEAPEEVVRLGLRAANLIGDGFYGVDIKQLDGRCVVIEINDNPNVDAGNEDGVLKDALYREVMGVFLRRIEERRRGPRP